MENVMSGPALGGGVMPSPSEIGAASNNEHVIKTFATYGSLGIIVGEETIESIVSAMPNNSVLRQDVGVGCNGAIYPTAYGIIEVWKNNDPRTNLIFYQKGTGKMWFGVYDGTMANKWTGWKGVFTEDGDALSGAYVYLNGGYSRWYNYKTGTQFEQMDAPRDSSNRTGILLYSLNTTLRKAIGLFRSTSGSTKNYDIYGGHNKPIATYTGNGSSASRTISTGGLGYAVLIWSENGMAIVTPTGVVKKTATGTSVSGLGESACKFGDGVLTIASTDTCLNANGITYNYQVL